MIANIYHIQGKLRFILPKSLLFAVFVITCFPSKSFSQDSLSFFDKHIHLSGQASLYGELYGIDGSARRRPPSTGRISITPSLRISEYFNISAQFLLSTEGTSGRQNINILGLHPEWEWGSAHIGDYSNSYSRYSFSGVNVTGAEINLFPGSFRFSLGGGQTRRAVEGTLVNESYDQYLIAARAGYGKENDSFFDLVFLKAKDDASSLKKPEDWDYEYVIPDTLETELDTLWVEPPYNPLSVTPQENLVFGFASKVSLFDSRLIVELDGNVSAFTKDLNAEVIDIDSIEANGTAKDVFTNIFKPHAGSSFDYSLNSSVKLNLKNVKMDFGFRHIGPGYFSLGIPSTVNDRQELLFNTSFKLGINRIRFGYKRLSDNLLNQKEQTNIRNQLQGSVATITERWRSQFNVRLLLMNNETDVDSLEWEFNNFIFSTNQTLLFGRESTLRQVGLKYTYQTSTKAMFAADTENNYHTFNLNTNLRFAQQLNLNASIGLSFRDSDTQGSYVTQVYSTRLIYTAMQNKLTSSLLCSSSMVRDTRVLKVGVNTGYKLAENYKLLFNLSYNNFSGTRDFNEYRASLMLTYRF